MYKENLVFELSNQRQELAHLIERIDQKLPLYMRGSLFIKNNYYYVKYYENGKTISNYLGKDLSDEKIYDVKMQLKNRKVLENRRKECVKELKEIEKLILKYGGTL